LSTTKICKGFKKQPTVQNPQISANLKNLPAQKFLGQFTAAILCYYLQLLLTLTSDKIKWNNRHILRAQIYFSPSLTLQLRNEGRTTYLKNSQNATDRQLHTVTVRTVFYAYNEYMATTSLLATQQRQNYSNYCRNV
jgi:hypothetical protein